MILQVILILPGYFEVKFTSGTITWVVKSYQNSTLSTVTVTASSASTRCTSGSARMIADDSNEESIFNDYLVYPNPVIDHITIQSPYEINTENVVISDMLGVYFIRIQNGEEVKIFSIIKQ